MVAPRLLQTLPSFTPPLFRTMLVQKRHSGSRFSVVKRPVAFSKRFKGARRRRRRGRRADQTILSAAAAAGQGLLGQLLDRVVSQAHTPPSITQVL